MGDHVAPADEHGPEPRRWEAAEAPALTPQGERRQASLLEVLRLRGWDVVALLLLTAIAFFIRFFSPITPNFIAHPFSGPAISFCVPNTPVDVNGDPGTLCGLAYPFTRGYKDPNGVLSPPNGQVFDEVYFPVDARLDVKGMEFCRPAQHDCAYNYFDPEPPLGKEMIGVGEWLYGWFRATFQGAHGDYIDLGFNTFGWRIAACIIGTLCVPLMYLLALRLWPNRLFAVAAAVLVCFDGMFFIQSRIGMIDIFPVFFILLAYYLFLVHRQSRTQVGSIVSLLLLGLTLGAGVSAKWVVLAAFASIVFFLLAGIVWRSYRSGDLELPGNVDISIYFPLLMLAFAVIPAVIYVGSWYPFFARGQFHTLSDLFAYNVQAYEYHANLKATHPYGSPWWSWPLLARPVLYYAEYTNLGTDQWSGQPLFALVYNLGNPWIWWTSIPCVLSLPYFIVRHRSFPAALILVGFVTQYLPWEHITRVLFLYEMIGGLIFMVLAVAFVLAWLAEHAPPWGRKVAIAYLVVAVMFFVYFYPVWAALPLSSAAWFRGDGSPPWGPKLWLTNCNYKLPVKDPQLFCWN